MVAAARILDSDELAERRAPKSFGRNFVGDIARWRDMAGSHAATPTSRGRCSTKAVTPQCWQAEKFGRRRQGRLENLTELVARNGGI